jgi:hypothetical protein
MADQSALSSCEMVNPPKPVCSLPIEMAFDPDLIDHRLIWVGFRVTVA